MTPSSLDLCSRNTKTKEWVVECAIFMQAEKTQRMVPRNDLFAMILCHTAWNCKQQQTSPLIVCLQLVGSTYLSITPPKFFLQGKSFRVGVCIPKLRAQSSLAFWECLPPTLELLAVVKYNMNLNVHKNDSVVWGTSPKHNFPTKMALELTPNFHGVGEDFM